MWCGVWEEGQAGVERGGQWGIAAGKPVSICVNSSAELLSTMESRTAFSLSLPLVTSNAIVLGYFEVCGVRGRGGVGAAAQITQITFKLRRVLLATFGPERERERECPKSINNVVQPAGRVTKHSIFLIDRARGLGGGGGTESFNRPTGERP